MSVRFYLLLTRALGQPPPLLVAPRRDYRASLPSLLSLPAAHGARRLPDNFRLGAATAQPVPRTRISTCDRRAMPTVARGGHETRPASTRDGKIGKQATMTREKRGLRDRRFRCLAHFLPSFLPLPWRSGSSSWTGCTLAASQPGGRENDGGGGGGSSRPLPSSIYSSILHVFPPSLFRCSYSVWRRRSAAGPALG